MQQPVMVGPWTLLDSAEEAEWLRDGVAGTGVVSALVPPLFEAYARVLHPALTSAGAHVRWADIGGLLGREIRQDSQFSELANNPGPDFPPGPADPATGEPYWSVPPEQGTLPTATAADLAAVLTPFAGDSTTCFYAVWEGFSDVTHLRAATRARLHLPDRSYLMFSGPHTAAAESISPIRHQSMNLWWPQRRQWLVATDIDHVSTYVGGSAACIQAVLDTPSLEAIPVSPTTSFLDQRR